MIKASVKVTDKTPAVMSKMERAVILGIDAAANVYEREVKRAHSDHYTTQQYRGTLNVRQSIRRTRPVKGPNGYESEVGTKLPQPLYWELGWQTKGKNSRLMRRRIWVPTALNQWRAIADAYAKVVAGMMKKNA